MLYYASGTLLSFYSEDQVPDILVATVKDNDVVFTQLYEQDNIFYYVCPAYPEYEQFSKQELVLPKFETRIATRQIYGVFAGTVHSNGIIKIGNHHTDQDRITLYLYFSNRVSISILDVKLIVNGVYQLADYLPGLKYVIIIE